MALGKYRSVSTDLTHSSRKPGLTQPQFFRMPPHSAQLGVINPQIMSAARAVTLQLPANTRVIGHADWSNVELATVIEHVFAIPVY